MQDFTDGVRKGRNRPGYWSQRMRFATDSYEISERNGCRMDACFRLRSSAWQYRHVGTRALAQIQARGIVPRFRTAHPDSMLRWAVYPHLRPSMLPTVFILQMHLGPQGKAGTMHLGGDE